MPKSSHGVQKKRDLRFYQKMSGVAFNHEMKADSIAATMRFECQLSKIRRALKLNENLTFEIKKGETDDGNEKEDELNVNRKVSYNVCAS